MPPSGHCVYGEWSFLDGERLPESFRFGLPGLDRIERFANAVDRSKLPDRIHARSVGRPRRV